MFDVSKIMDPEYSTDPEQRPITVNMADRAALMQRLETDFNAQTGFSLATINLDHLVKITRDSTFRAAYARHNIVTADGNPIVWLCRLAGQKVSLIPGSELIDPVSELAARLNVPVAFLGSNAASLEAAGATLQARHPRLDIVLRYAPAMGFDPTGPEAAEAIAALKESGARLVFLALGAPKQEIFATHAQAALPQTGFISIGAGLDFLSGSQVRAPLFMRRLALEWFWRLIQNPRRLSARYAACLAILPRAGLAALRVRLRKDLHS